ncbi:MAG: DUF2971 domain-containing protein [Gammaproteobacteria bacterium]|nr:DUF2971 domain-containing protein [Pseudomonadales bacterium]
MIVPKNLYKYLSPERIDVLQNKQIRFTQPEALNDPFELKPLFEELLPESAIEKALSPSMEYLEPALREQYRELPAANKALISEDGFVQLIANNPDLVTQVYREMEPRMRSFIKDFAPEAKRIMSDILSKEVGILSLSESIDSNLLWSHYAASHTGFVLEFDTSNQFFQRRRSENDELYHLRKVVYRDRCSEGRTLEDINGEDILLTKGSSWEYETEWRVLAPTRDASVVLQPENDPIYLFDFPPSVVSRVILGAKCSEDLAPKLKSIIELDSELRPIISKIALNESSQKLEVIDLASNK